MRTRRNRPHSRIRRAKPYTANNPLPFATLMLFLSALFLILYDAKLVESTLLRGPSMLITDPIAYQAFMESAQPYGGFVTTMNPMVPFFPFVFLFAVFVASAPKAQAHPAYPSRRRSKTSND